MQMERRRLKRRHLIYYLKVFKADAKEMLGFLVDVTPQGVMLMSENPLPTGETYPLKISLETDLYAAHELRFEARSIWSRKNPSSNYFDTGFEIVGTSPEDIETIETLIQRLAFRDL